MIDKEDNLIKIGIEEGNEIFFKILDDYPELEEKDPRRGAVLLSLMTNCVVQLHAMGWSEKNLVNEVFDWCKISRELLDEDEEE
jgi:hypothetical protein